MRGTHSAGVVMVVKKIKLLLAALASGRPISHHSTGQSRRPSRDGDRARDTTEAENADRSRPEVTMSFVCQRRGDIGRPGRTKLSVCRRPVCLGGSASVKPARAAAVEGQLGLAGGGM